MHRNWLGFSRKTSQFSKMIAQLFTFALTFINYLRILYILFRSQSYPVFPNPQRFTYHSILTLSSLCPHFFKTSPLQLVLALSYGCVNIHWSVFLPLEITFLRKNNSHFPDSYQLTTLSICLFIFIYLLCTARSMIHEFWEESL